ncbi:MAG: polysaccharide lyase family protein [Limisphaerales bacterium]
MKPLIFKMLGMFGCLIAVVPVFANLPGGGTNGPDVTLTDNGSTVTMANGIVSILCIKSGATLSQINYIYNNSGTTVTNQLLNGGTDGGEFYWETGGFGTGTFTYSVVSNTSSYCEIDLLSASTTNGVMDVHFSMLRGSPGFYVAAVFSHRASDVAMNMGETRDNIYAGAIFNWMCVDAARNRLMEVQPGAGAIGVLGAPVEVTLWTNGIYQGRYEDKYKYSADFGVQRVWGWGSVGAGGGNVGLWNVSASAEYYSDGPMKRDLMSHIGTTILNYYESSHYGGNMTDGNWTSGEIWSKVYGPYFIYCNNITNTVTDTNQAAQMLYQDALAQAAAEATAWPYYWFANTNYASAAQRGAVTGQFAIDDLYNPNASPAGLWVGLVQQPATSKSVYDFQQWMKTCQFWAKTDTNGNFTIPNVIAGGNYTMFAFGPGAAGTFQSQALTGGEPPNTMDIPASPFSVTVTGGATNNLGTVTWTPTRVGPTVFEIGYPDRTGAKFRHGDDYWVGDIGPSPANPSPIWSKFLEYPFDFPNGVYYTVGQNRWTTDWNFVQPVVSSTGTDNNSTSTITFYLPTVPANGATASLYIATASDFQGALIISVNNANLGSASGVTATPNALPTTGYAPAYSGSGYESDTTVREGINSVLSDERVTFPASLLQAGQNTITLGLRQVGGASSEDHAMYDYLRLELTGYVPPSPASVAAYAGNNCNLVCWPVTPGATSYNIYSTTTSGSGYGLVASGVTGPVCGSGWNNATYLDTNAVNGNTYYYVVQSVNPTGASTNSPESPGAMPAAGISTSAPAAPAGLAVSSVSHQSVTLNWSPSSGANYYTVFRSTLVNNGGGASNVLGTIVLANNVTGTTYTDTSPTDGSIYSYSVAATGAGGTSTNSAPAVGVPLPAPPASAPGSLTGSFVQTTNITLNWSAVSGAVGYIISRATSPSGPFTFLMSVTETTYTDVGLSPSTLYYYQVAAVNAAGVSANATVSVVAAPSAPASLSAVPGDTQVILTWSAVSGATGYFLYTGTTSNNVTTLVIPNYTGTSYTNTGLADGTTYYYVVAATNSGGLSPNSPEASATPSAVVVTARNLTWKGDGSANLWNVDGAANWQTNGVATIFNNGDTVTFDNTGSNNVPVSLAGTLQPALVIVTNLSTKSYTFSGTGSISGTNMLIKTGPGTLIISATNTYTGGTTVSNGSLTFSIGAAIPPTGTLTLNNTGAVTVTTANSLPNVLVNGTNAITGNGNSGTGIATLNDSGTLTLFVSGGSDVFDLTGTMTGSGTLALGTSAMTLRFNGTGGDGNAIFNLGTGTAVASVRNTGTTAIALGGLTGGASTQLQGDNSSGGANMTYTIGGASANAEFDGVILNGTVGTVAVTKTGGNTQTFTNANTYTAGTTINGGTLLVNNAKGSGTGAGAVMVASGGTLAGNGIISGTVSVNSGGSIAPGNPLGTLTISNNLTLAAGSTTLVQVGHSPLTNTLVRIIGSTLTEGGTLVVSNAGVAAFTAGDNFKLFTAAGYSGAFGGFTYPSLNPGLAWNTTRLNVDGTIWVVSTVSPRINSTRLLGINLALNGTGGTPNWYYYVLSSTNLTLPTAQWTRVVTNQFDSGGNFALTNAINSNWPQTFYRLQLQ